MSLKKSIKRRSNWYIYLLTFMIMSLIVSFVIYNIWDFLFPAENLPAMSTSADYRPDASFNATFLLMLSENKGAVPDYYMLLNYRPGDEAILVVPVKSNLYAEVGYMRGTLTEHYLDGGAGGVMHAIQNSLGVEADHYIKFDKDSFIGFLDEAGFTPVNVPYDLNGGAVDFLAGSYEFTGEDLYNYITYPDYEQGEDYRFMVQGVAVANFINKNSRNLSVPQLQSLFYRILNTDTSLDFNDFVQNQQAYMFTTQNSFNLADYYVPIGTTNSSGHFTVSETAAATIRDRF
ncbi:MAG: LCP family protein [Oscillospiraceae bacterium]|nr:LCP family protein [Oscillospiraceae bacterium]